MENKENMESIVAFMLEHWPGLIFALAFGAIVWFFVSYHYKHVHPTEKKVKSLPCQKHEADISKLTGNSVDLEMMKESIRKIEEFLMGKDSKAYSQLVRKCSPYALTSFGETLLKDSGGKECIDKNEIFFFSQIEELHPRVALDVEQYSLTILKNNVKDERFDEIKNYIFCLPSPAVITNKEGESIEMPVYLDTILMLMSIYLRDRYLAEHPRIAVQDLFSEENQS
ncbi:MAG: hypothetical protein K2M99_08375 [Treponemataceae bacterium]|nr:hypothetical protein [Treponemataceae bacterium]